MRGKGRKRRGGQGEERRGAEDNSSSKLVGKTIPHNQASGRSHGNRMSDGGSDEDG